MAARRRAWLLGAIALVGLLLRAITVDGRFSSDDAYTWYVAHAPTLDAFYDRLIAFENAPPLYYLIVRWLPDATEAWVRGPAVLCSAACIPVVYAIARPLLGTRVALLAAAGLAVAPFALTQATLARGFALADLALLVVVWAAARLAQGRGRRWWWLYGAGSVVALYSQYTSPLVLLLVAGALLLIGTPRRRETLLFAALPALAFVPWLPSLADSLDAASVTKVPGVLPDATLDGARIALNALVYGRLRFEEAGAPLPVVRALAALLALAGCVALLWRHGDRRRIAFWLTAGVAGAVFVVHWILAALGAEGVFDPRYMSIVVPLMAIAAAAAIDAVPWRPAVPVAAVVLAVLVVATAALRWGRDPNPDLTALRTAVAAEHPGTVLTNTAIVVHGLRDLPVRLDRAFGLGPNLEQRCARACPGPVIVVDDTAATAGGTRSGPGRAVAFDRFVMRRVPAQRRVSR